MKAQSQIITASPVNGRAVANSVQPKLNVSKPGDMLEREADTIAERVISPSQDSLNLQVEEEDEKVQKCPCDDEEIQTSKQTDVEEDPRRLDWISSQLRNSEGNGVALPEPDRTFMESRFGNSFRNVRIHNDQESYRMNQSLHSRAFTHRNHIYFDTGRFDASTTNGKRLLAHELTHVVQQGHAPVANAVQRDLAVEPPNPGAEPVPLTPEQVSAALHYNLDRFANREELGVIRDVLGISPAAEHLIDEDFVRAVGRWQAMHNLDQDGKLGVDTITTLVAEYQGEAALAPEMRPRGERLNIRTRSDERRNNIDVNGKADLFDALLSHRNAMLTLLMKINFQFYADSSGTALNATEQADFIRRFRSDVYSHWSEMYALVPSGSVLQNYLDTYYAEIRIESTATDPHYTAHVTRTSAAYETTDPTGPVPSGGPAASSGSRWLRVGSSDVGLFTGTSRGGHAMRQFTSAHEFGHMLGLPHVHCDTNSDACYGVSDEERANIMGLGNRVDRSNFAPFTAAMREITGENWRAR